MIKLSLIFLALSSLSCAQLPLEQTIYQPRLKVIDHEGERLICQDEDDTLILYKRLRECEDYMGETK